jgi:CRISP-associated protein Cas1
MMSVPDLKEKQIVFVGGSEICENQLSLKNENILLRKPDGTKNRISCHKVLAVFVVGECTITSKLIRKCQEQGVSLFLLNSRFRQYCAMPALAEGNYALRARQYAFDQDLAVAKNIVQNKISNQRQLLRKAKLNMASESVLSSALEKAAEAETLDSLRGIEGNAAKEFFGQYFSEQKWYRRMPRTKVDISNLLLDMGYTMLFNMVDACASLHGFDTYKGIYHQLFFQRKSLVCDLMEPFRCIVDLELKKSYNLKRIREGEFEFSQGKYLLPYEYQGRYVGIFAEAIMAHKEDIFCYVRDYYYCVLNETDNYPTFNI